MLFLYVAIWLFLRYIFSVQFWLFYFKYTDCIGQPVKISRKKVSRLQYQHGWYTSMAHLGEMEINIKISIRKS